MIAVFQQMEVDYIIGRPNKDVHLTDLAEVPIIRMYGVTESGVNFDGHVPTVVVKRQRTATEVQVGLSDLTPVCCRKQRVCFCAWI